MTVKGWPGPLGQRKGASKFSSSRKREEAEQGQGTQSTGATWPNLGIYMRPDARLGENISESHHLDQEIKHAAVAFCFFAPNDWPIVCLHKQQKYVVLCISIYIRQYTRLYILSLQNAAYVVVGVSTECRTKREHRPANVCFTSLSGCS